MTINTWLDEQDIKRIWNVVHEEGIPENVTEKELVEFQRIIDQVIASRVLH